MTIKRCIRIIAISYITSDQRQSETYHMIFKFASLFALTNYREQNPNVCLLTLFIVNDITQYFVIYFTSHDEGNCKRFSIHFLFAMTIILLCILSKITEAKS